MVQYEVDSGDLGALSGRSIASELHQEVHYRLERRIGEGGMGMAFLALRQAPDGVSPVVIKLVRPDIVANQDQTASILVQKEAVALGRLNERVPPTPFVVRLVDTGLAAVFGPDAPAVPWLAVEYVHGGIEGTTLDERVSYCVEHTGYAFDPNRAAHLWRCLASGLSAIHAVGVVHRDVTPGNILCCGFGEAEIFKISDFGIARPQGLASTFGGVVIGTPGYAAPEQNFPDKVSIGTYSDVFSLACVLYFALTGEDYFPVTSPVQAVMRVKEQRRASLLDGKWLSPELRERPEACRAIDHALARATAFDTKQRPESAQELAAGIVPWLTDGNHSPRPSRRLMNSLLNLSSPGDLSKWTWTVRHPSGDDRVMRSAAWDADGRCFALTTEGPQFWNGQTWLNAGGGARALPSGLNFASRLEAGGWLLGGDAGLLAVYGTDGIREQVRAPDDRASFLHANGRFDDLLTAVSQAPGQEPVLWALAARRWMKPLPLSGVGYVAALLRLDDSHWLLCGRLAHGGGFAAIYAPMQWEVTFLLVPKTRAFVAGTSQTERGLGLAVGSQGVAVRVEHHQPTASVAEGQFDLTAAAMDVLDREWVASAGRLWVRDPARNTSWQCVWHDPKWTAPFVSLMADAGMVVAMSADGGVLEGRAQWLSARRSRR